MNLLPEPRIYKVELELDNIASKYMYIYKRGFSKKELRLLVCTEILNYKKQN